MFWNKVHTEIFEQENDRIRITCFENQSSDMQEKVVKADKTQL